MKHGYNNSIQHQQQQHQQPQPHHNQNQNHNYHSSNSNPPQSQQQQQPPSVINYSNILKNSSTTPQASAPVSSNPRQQSHPHPVNTGGRGSTGSGSAPNYTAPQQQQNRNSQPNFNNSSSGYQQQQTFPNDAAAPGYNTNQQPSTGYNNKSIPAQQQSLYQNTYYNTKNSASARPQQQLQLSHEVPARAAQPPAATVVSSRVEPASEVAVVVLAENLTTMKLNDSASDRTAEVELVSVVAKSSLASSKQSNEFSSSSSLLNNTAPLPRSPSPAPTGGGLPRFNDSIQDERDKVEYYRSLMLAADRLYPDTKFPLQDTWTFGYIRSDSNAIRWEDNIKEIIDVSYVEDFWAVANNMLTPTYLSNLGDLTFFKKGIRPMWEDAENKNGGSWLHTIGGGMHGQFKNKQQPDIDDYWMETLMALVGDNFCADTHSNGNCDESVTQMGENQLGDAISGFFLAHRGKAWKLALWTKNYKDEKTTRLIGFVLVSLIIMLYFLNLIINFIFLFRKRWKQLLKINEITTIHFEVNRNESKAHI